MAKTWLVARGVEADECAEDKVVVELRRQVQATELKAELTEFRIRRVQTNTAVRVERKISENASLLLELSTLR